MAEIRRMLFATACLLCASHVPVSAQRPGLDGATAFQTFPNAGLGTRFRAESPASIPAPDPELGAIAVNMPEVFGVYFARLGPEEDLFAPEAILGSNLRETGWAYLLDARPGRYVAVAAVLRDRVRGGSEGPNRTEMSLMLPDKSTIAQTEIEVEPGKIAFMGRFLIESKVKMAKADAVQAHYFGLIAPEAARKTSEWRGLTGGARRYRGVHLTIDRSPTRRMEFRTREINRVFHQEPARREENALRMPFSAQIVPAPEPSGAS